MSDLVPYIRTLAIIYTKRIYRQFSLHKHYNYTPFVILCPPRSGSTLLHTYLNSHQNIQSWGELVWNKIEECADDHLLKDKLLGAQSTKIRAVGFKMFYAQTTNKRCKTVFQYIIRNRDIKVIHLKRENILEQYVSQIIAEKTGIWSTNNEATAKAQNHVNQVTIDIDEFACFESALLEDSKRVETQFNEHLVLNITYEDLLHKPEETLSSVQRFLAVPSHTLFTLLKKQNVVAVDEIINNIDVLRRYFGKYC